MTGEAHAETYSIPVRGGPFQRSEWVECNLLYASPRKCSPHTFNAATITLSLPALRAVAFGSLAAAQFGSAFRAIKETDEQPAQAVIGDVAVFDSGVILLLPSFRDAHRASKHGSGSQHFLCGR